MNAIPETIRAGRDRIAKTFLAGRGIEIGPGNAPLRFAPRTIVDYVDFASKEELVKKYGVSTDWTTPDIIDDAELLQSISDSSLDFIVACHVLEHTQNPLQVLEVWFSKLKPNGVAFIAIPDRGFSFDRERPLTPFEHLLADYREGPENSEEAHLHEWVTLVDGVVDQREIERRKTILKEIGYRIHYHVWNTTSFAELLTRCNGIVAEFDIEFCGRNDTEAVAVVRKKPRDPFDVSADAAVLSKFPRAGKEHFGFNQIIAAQHAKAEVLEGQVRRNRALIENLASRSDQIPYLESTICRLKKDLTSLGDKLASAERLLTARGVELGALARALVGEEERAESYQMMSEKLLKIMRVSLEPDHWWWRLMPRSWLRKRFSEKLAQLEIFDADAYAVQFPDVATSGQDPFRHFIFHGAQEIGAGNR